MSELTVNDPATIKAYFEKVRQLAKSGEMYPVDLDEVWPLVYAEKGVAIRALKKSFFENDDYRVFDQNVKNSAGGRPEKEYRLTSSCMEHLVARKVTAVFEVYRQVFHKVAEIIESKAELSDDELFARAVVVANRKLEAISLQLHEAQETIQKQAPKVEYVDRVLDTTDCVVTTIIANEMGYSAVRFNKMLNDMGIQWKVSGVWVLTSKYLNKGYVQMKTHTFVDPKTNQLRATEYMVWTQRGRAFLWWTLKHQKPPQIEIA